MDNQKLVIGAIVAVALFLGAPIVLKSLNGNATSAVAVSSAPVAARPAAQPSFPATQQQAAPEQQQQQYQQYQPAMPAQGAGLNAQTLVGTAWEAQTLQGNIQIELNAGGQATASHPLVGQVAGSWSVQGDQLIATVSAYGQTQTIAAQIRGDKLECKGYRIRRLR